ncbi:isopropylmalate isomerase [Blastomonas sp. SL216]|uniref:isopropylmalate isomerase n=1 Tax=Blastomonas sp. SL216 TaxID=2995169 RepID=UPI002376EBDA|nr:isopropylmalate isomerase [Blastomonas sp. SL216]
MTKDKKNGWSNSAMAGAAVGSAALAAALLYVGKQFSKPKPDTAGKKPEEPGAEATEGPHATD